MLVSSLSHVFKFQKTEILTDTLAFKALGGARGLSRPVLLVDVAGAATSGVAGTTGGTLGGSAGDDLGGLGGGRGRSGLRLGGGRGAAVLVV
jgi:hypothetical protein